MYTKCPECGRLLRDTGRDMKCPGCGRAIKTRIRTIYAIGEEESPLAAALDQGVLGFFERVVSFGSLIALMTFLMALGMCVAALIIGVPEVLAHAHEDPGILYIITPALVGILALPGYANSVYYIFLVTAIIMSLAFPLLTEGKQSYRLTRNCLSELEAPGRDNRNTFFMTAQVFMAILTIDVVYAIILLATNTSPEVPDFESLEKWELYYIFAQASVWEEVTARIMLIGVPLVLYKFFRNYMSGDGEDHLADPAGSAKRVARFCLGGWNRFDIPTVGLITFSSMMFGLAHYGGWDLLKVVPTILAGFGFGFLYVRKGVHAAIILHFAFDYMDMGFGLLPTTETVATLSLLFFGIWALAGIMYLAFYIRKALRWFVKEDGDGPIEVTAID